MSKSALVPASTNTEETTLTPVALEYPKFQSDVLVKTKCKSCAHFKTIANPAYASVCSKLGILEDSTPCRRYHADYRQLGIVDIKEMGAFAKIVSTLSETQLKMLSTIFNRETRTRRNGFKFGQRIYLRLFGGDYISNYRCAVVISAEKDMIKIEGDKNFHAFVFKQNVLTVAQWERKKKQLQKANKLVDPTLARYTRKQSTTERKDHEDYLKQLEATVRRDLMIKSDEPETRKKKSRGLVEIDQVINKPFVADRIRTRSHY